MKIDQDLRAAIRSAEKAQPSYAALRRRSQGEDAMKTRKIVTSKTKRPVAARRVDVQRVARPLGATAARMAELYRAVTDGFINVRIQLSKMGISEEMDAILFKAGMATGADALEVFERKARKRPSGKSSATADVERDNGGQP